MRKVYLILTILLSSLLLPTVVFADSASSGDGGGGFAKTCHSNCPGWMSASNGGGVRITFIDANGRAIAGTKSYDFYTKASSNTPKFSKTIYNVSTEPRHRFANNFVVGDLGYVTNLPYMKNLITRYYQEKGMAVPASYQNPKGNELDGFRTEIDWFLEITDTKKAAGVYNQNVQALIKAMQAFYPDMPSNMYETIKHTCDTSDSVFIIMEPLLYYTTHITNTHFLGTLKDYVTYKGEFPTHASRAAQAMFYDGNNPLPRSAGFQAAYAVTKSQIKMTSIADINNNAGWGFVIDWANNNRSTCNACEFDKDTKTIKSDKGNYPGSLTNPGGYKDLGDYITSPSGLDCCDTLQENYMSLTSEMQNWYKTYCDNQDKSCQIIGSTYYCNDGKPCTEERYQTECGECCHLDPINVEDLDAEINNCCENTHSYINEPNLNDLFCKHNGLNVDYYWAKCNADYFKDTSHDINKYCELYCTERITIDVPGPITAKSGRYFKLTQNPVGNTTSPYIDGYRRCRIIVHYDDWEKDYINTVHAQVTAYNNYQYYAAMVSMYENASKTTVSGTVNTSRQCYHMIDVPNECEEGVSEEECGTHQERENTRVVSGTTTYSYSKYTMTSKDYYTLTIGEKSVTGNSNNHTGFTYSQTKNSTSAKTIIYDIGSARSGAYAAANRLSCPSGESADTGTYGAINSIYSNENYEGTLSNLKWYRDNAKKTYVSHVNSAKTLESQLDTCDDYFNITSKDSMYEFNAQLSFKYNQIYRNEKGESILDETEIAFKKTPGCKIDGPSGQYGSEDTISPGYSTVYGTDNFVGNDFTTSIGLAGDGGYTNYIDRAPHANRKIFRHDARYHVTCEWEEDDNVINTLVPDGVASETTEKNFTLHKREYKVFLTTYVGTFETDWSLTGVGNKGKFDDVILNNKTTCGDQDATSDKTFSCKLKVDYEIVFTGKCNPTDEVTTNIEDCTIVDNVDALFQFKIVDEANLFPTGTTTADGKEIAHNWTKQTKGINARKEIEEKGKRGTTYAPENASYEFYLTPATMRHIRNYNATRNNNGGYSDFELKCDCPTIGSSVKSTYGYTPAGYEYNACVKCKSTLIEGIYSGYITYNGATHRVNAWASNKDLNTIREPWR